MMIKKKNNNNNNILFFNGVTALEETTINLFGNYNTILMLKKIFLRNRLFGPFYFGYYYY